MFGNKKNNKTWSAAVLKNGSKKNVPKEQLQMLTGNMITNHCRIIKDSARIIQSTKNPDTHESRKLLSEEHYAELLKLEPYATSEQLIMIEECKRLMRGI